MGYSSKLSVCYRQYIDHYMNRIVCLLGGNQQITSLWALHSGISCDVTGAVAGTCVSENTIGFKYVIGRCLSKMGII